MLTSLSFLLLLQAVPVGGETDGTVVVTGTRSLDGLRPELSGSSLTVLDEGVLEARQTRIVSDVLRDVPGVAVSRSGAVGGQTQVRLRGAEANQTLVLIDGIEAADPFQGEFDFATLIADDTARIEVLRGQQSAIYGSDAIGGVIHYITASGAEAPGVRGRIEGGSHGTVTAAARAAGVSGKLDYALNAAFSRTNGTPTARKGIGNRRLDADNRQLSAKLGLELSPTIRLKAVGRYSRLEADTNPQDFDFTAPTYGFVIDGQDDLKSRAFYGLARAEADLLDGRWTHAVTLQGNDTRRVSRTAGDPTFATRGSKAKAAYDTTFRFDGDKARHSLTGAIDYERERFRNVALFGAPTPVNARRTTDNLGLVAEYGLTVADRIGFGASLRHDDNDRFGDATTYRVRGSLAVLPSLRLRAAAGSGIKAPTNFELFGFDPATFIGNPDLKPEKSRGWEAGADLALAEGRASLGATWFDSRLRNEIYTAYSPTFVSSPANRTTRSTQRGVEAFGTARIGRAWRIDLAYTWLDAEENGAREVRRPRHSGSANLAWTAPENRAQATLTMRYNGAVRDSNFTNLPLGPFARLDDFVLVNLAGELALTAGVQLFARVENLADEDYEEVFTYRAPGRTAYAGVRARF